MADSRTTTTASPPNTAAAPQPAASAAGTPTVEELLAQIVAGDTGALVDEAQYHGVNPGYVAEVERPETRWSGRAFGQTWQGNVAQPAGVVAVPPRYKVGDEMKPRTWGTKRIAELQDQLEAAGFLQKGKYRRSAWGPESADAYAALLAYSNQAGTTWEDAAGSISAMPSPVDEDAIPPLQYEMPNDDELRRTFSTVARALKGSKVDPTTIERMIQSYKTQEMGVQKANYDAAISGRQGATQFTTTDSESPEGFAQDFIEEEFEEDVEGFSFAQRAGEFFDLVQGGK